MFNTFISQLETFLNTTRTEMNLTDLWTTSSPLASSPAPPALRTLLNTTYADLISLDQIALVADPFIADYKAAFGGRTPFIDPAPLNRWAYGRAFPNATARKEEAIANKTVFMDWFQKDVVGSNNDTCSDAIFLYPQSSGRTQYRNEYITYVFSLPHGELQILTFNCSAPGAPLGFSTGRIAVHAEVPDMVVPSALKPFFDSDGNNANCSLSR